MRWFCLEQITLGKAVKLMYTCAAEILGVELSIKCIAFFIQVDRLMNVLVLLMPISAWPGFFNVSYSLSILTLEFLANLFLIKQIM